MAFVVSDGSLQGISRPYTSSPYTSVQLADDFTQTYAQLWRAQPAVRMVVSFLARNIGSLGLHAFQRVSDTDRRRLADDPMARLIERPNPITTRYRLVNATVSDLGIYDDAFWRKIRDTGNRVTGVVRLPAHMVTPYEGTWLEPEKWRVRGNRGYVDYAPQDVVHFYGFNPDDPRVGCSPLESLRRILAEEYEAGRMREQTLRNGARASGYIERPVNAPDWRTNGGAERFKVSWQQQYAGNGNNAGGTPVLEDGMTFKPAAQTSEQLQYIEARKLTREEVAAAYFIPPPMVGILDHATFSNIEEQHRMLYQDTLGPWLEMLQQEIELQLLPDVTTTKNVYIEFNLAQKLAGSFDQQAKSVQTLTGRPIMTANEGRARMNLSSLDDPDADRLITPMNVTVGGQASPTDSGTQNENSVADVLAKFHRRQAARVKSALGASAGGWWDAQRWDDELADDLEGAHPAPRIAAELVNVGVKQRLDVALTTDDPTRAVAAVFDTAVQRADQTAQELEDVMEDRC